MEALGLEKTEVSVCERCKHRFYCFTTRNTPSTGLCGSGFLELDVETVKQIHIEKAKKQGRYFPTEEPPTNKRG